MIEYSAQNKGKIALHYDITLACNNRCWYCYTLETLDNKKLINEDTFYNFIDACNNYHDYIKVDILGGEPLIVHDRVIELIDRTACKQYNIISNLNFNPDSQRMQEVREYVHARDRVMITGSWHYENNDLFFKQNVLDLKGKVHVVLLAGNDNTDEVLQQRDWLIQNGIPFDVEPLYGEDPLRDFDLFQKDIDQVHPLDIAMNNRVICELSTVKVDWYGNMRPICHNPTDLGNIKDGINLKQTYCHKWHCKCTTYNYKRVL